MSDSVKAILDKYRTNNGPVSRRELSASMAKKLEDITPKFVPQDPEPKVNPNAGNVNYIDHSQNPTATRLQEMQPSDWATGDNVRNYVNAAAGGVTQAVGGFNAFVGNMTAAVPNAIDLARGGDGVTTDEWINTIGKKTGNYAAKDWLQKQKTHETLQKEAKLQAILSDPNKGEWEKAGETVGFYLKNPNFLAQEATKVTAQSILEMGGWGKVIGAVAPAASVATRAGVASGMGAYSGGVAEVAANPNKELTARSQFAQLAKGFVVGGITGGVSKYMPAHNIDNVLVGGGTSQFGKGGLTVGTIKAALQEGGEEFPQEFLEAVIDNIDDKNPAFYNALAMGAQGFMLGAVSGGGMSAFVNSPGAIDQTGVGVMSAIQEGLSKRKAAKEGTAEQQSNPESDKYNPAKVFNQSLVDARSSDPAIRAAAEENIALTSARAHAKLAEYTDAIENETNTETKTKLKAEREYYVERIMDPLIERIVANQNAIAANKDSEGADNYDSLVAEYRKLSQIPSPTPVEQPIESTEAVAPVQLTTPVVGAPVTPSTPLKRAVNPKDNQPKVSAPKATGKSLASIIQGGESGAAAHSAVNYGSGKAKGNLDPTKMTVGALKKGLSNGEFVAVGKYQFHKSSFAEMAKKLPWVNDSTVLTAEVQDRIFAEHYVGSKRKGLGDYIRGGKTSLASANDALAQEWQAAQGSQGKGLLGAGATIKTADIQAGLVQSRAIYKEMKGKGATDAQAMLAAVTGGLGSNSQAAAKTRNPSRYISYGNSNSKRNEKLDSNLEQKLGFLEDMGVTFKVNSGGQSATSKGKVGSTAHNHGHAGDGDLYHKGRKLSFNDVNDRAMLADIIEEAAANGINGIGAGYMGDGRIHFGTQTKSAAWGGGKDASAPAYAWVAQAHARGLARRPTGGGGSISTTSNTGPAYIRSEASSIESTKRLDTKVTSLIDNTDMTAEEIVNTDPKEAEKTDVGKRIMSATRNIYSTLSDEEIEKHPLLSTEQKDALRKMNEIKREAAKNTTTNEVSRVIREGKQGPTKIESDMGTKQYQEAIDRAIATNDGRTAKRYLGQLDTFVENQISKARVIEDNIDTATGSAPLFVAPDSKGIWSVVSEEVSKTPEFKEAGGLSFWGRNELSDAIADDAVYLDEFRSGITNVAAALVKGIKPVPSLKSATPLTFNGTPPVTTPTSTPPVAAVTSTGVKTIYTKVGSAAEATDGFFLGRGPKSVSMSQVVNGDTVKLENIGKPGWLASSENVGTPTQKVAAYVGKFKSNFTSHDEFAQGVIDLKGQKLYAHNLTSPNSETSFLNELIQTIPTDITEAKAYVARITGYTPAGGISLGVETFSNENAEKIEGAITDDTFGFNAKNQYDLRIVTDNSYKANKAKIDAVLANIDPTTAKFPNSGLGANLETSAPRTFAYLNTQLKAKLGIDNQEVIKNYVAPAVEGRSVFDGMSKKTEGNVKAAIAALGIDTEVTIKKETAVVDVLGVVVPVEMTLKHKLEDLKDTYDLIQPGLMSKKEAKLYKSIIDTLVNFNPNIQLQLTTKGTSYYEKGSNTITVNMMEKGTNIVQTIAKLMVASTTESLANRLEGKKDSELTAESADVIKLNSDLSSVKRDIETLISTNIDEKVKARLINGIESNAKMLRLVNSDSEVVKLLMSTKSSTPSSKSESSIFNKIASALRSFFNIAPDSEISTVFDRLLETVAQTAELQARNNEVNFTPSELAKLRVFQDVIDEQVENELKKDFRFRDQLLVGFTQKANKGKPLTSISNLSSKMKLDIMQGLGVLNSKAPTTAQRKQIEDFLKFNDDFAVHAKATFKRKSITAKGDFAFQDLKGFLGTPILDGKNNIVDVVLNENTITAAALAAYSWSIEYGSANTTKDSTIRSMLNLDPNENDYIAPAIREQYQYMTDRSVYAGNTLGTATIQALNIKPNGNLRKDALSALENSTGAWVLATMQAANLIHIETMPSTVHEANIKAVGGNIDETIKGEQQSAFSEKGTISFISVSGRNGGRKNKRMDEIAFMSKNTTGYMSEVFGVEVGLRAPQKVKPTQVIRDVKRTSMITGKTQVAFMKKMQEEPIVIDTDMYKSLNALLDASRDTTLQMIGASISEEALANEHKDDRMSKLSAAEGIMRDLENSQDFIGGLEEQEDGSLQPFYDQVYAAKNNRMHYLSNMFNFQSSLLHRAMGQYKNFKTEVDLNEAIIDEEGKLSGFGMFMKSIAEQAEGTEKLIKAKLFDNSPYTLGFTQDKLPGEVFVPLFEKYLNEDEQVLAAVDAAKVLLLNPEAITQKQVDDIASLVEFWEMGAGSLRALLEYTKMQIAFDNNMTTMTTYMGLGSDGVNNGIALANVLLGTASAAFLDQVGMYTKDSDFKNYFESRTDSSVQDYYENFAKVIQREVELLRLENKNVPKALEELNALLNLNKSFQARKNTKAILIPFGYSAGMKRLKQLAYGQFLADIKSTMKDIANGEDTDGSLHANLKENLEKLLGRQVDLPYGKDLLEFWFEFKDLNDLQKKYINTVGGVVQSSLETYAGDFMGQRDLNIKMQNAASEAYLDTKKVLEAIGEAEYRADNPHITDAMFAEEGIPAKDFVKYIESKYADLRPTIKAPLNLKDNDTKSNFVLLDEVNQMRAGRGEAVNLRANSQGKLAPVNSAIAERTREEKDAGVGPNSSQVQGTDAYIAARTSAQGGTVNINIHDAGISGFNNFTDMVIEQNKATYEILRDYSSQSESMAAMAKMFIAISDAKDAGTVTEELFKATITKAYKRITGDTEVGSLENKQIINFFKGIKESVLATDKRKFDIIKNLEYVHQYAGENGEYKVPTDDSKAIAAAQKALDKNTRVMDKLIQKLGGDLAPLEPAGTLDTKYLENIQPKRMNANTVTNHSGGAYGADTAWDVVGREFGVVNHNHYRAASSGGVSKRLKAAGVKPIILTEQQLVEARDNVNELLGTEYINDVRGNLQARNFLQVDNADMVLAVGTLKKDMKGVTGGTNTAVQLAIKMDKPIFVWDVKSSQWYGYTTQGFVKSDTPVLSENFAGIGTRDIESYQTKDKKTGQFIDRPQYLGNDVQQKAEQAIRDVYAKSISKYAKTKDELYVQSVMELGWTNEPHKDITTKVVAFPKNINLRTIRKLLSESGSRRADEYESNALMEEWEMIKIRVYKYLLAKPEIMQEMMDAHDNEVILLMANNEDAQYNMARAVIEIITQGMEGVYLEQLHDISDDGDLDFNLSKALMPDGRTILSTVRSYRKGFQDVLASVLTDYFKANPKIMAKYKKILDKGFALDTGDSMENYRINKAFYQAWVNVDSELNPKDPWGNALDADGNYTDPDIATAFAMANFNMDDEGNKVDSTYLARMAKDLTEKSTVAEATAIFDLVTMAAEASQDFNLSEDVSDAIERSYNSIQALVRFIQSEAGINSQEELDAYLEDQIIPAIFTEPLNAREALFQWETDNTVLGKYLLEEMEANNPNIRLAWVSELTDEYGQHKGQYNPVTNTITLSRKYFDGVNNKDRTTVLAHEMTHALTEFNIMNNMSTEARDAVNTLEAMRIELQDKETDPFTKNVVFGSISEMVAYGSTETRYLAKIANGLDGKYASKSRTTGENFLGFLRAIKGLFTNRKAKANAAKFTQLVNTLMQSDGFNNLDQGQIRFSTMTASEIIKAKTSTTLSTDFNSHIDGLLDRLMTQLYENIVSVKTKVDATIANVDLSAIHNGFAMSDKELYTSEALKATIESYLTSLAGTKPARELLRIFEAAEKQIKVEDFLEDPSTASAADMAQAQKMYDYAFSHSGSSNEQFERFFALTLSNQKMYDVVNKVDTSKAKRGDGKILDKLMDIFSAVMEWVTNNSYKLSRNDTSKNIVTLMNKLASIDAAARLNHEHLMDRAYGKVMHAYSKPVEAIGKALSEQLFSKVDLTNSRIESVATLARVYRAGKKTGVMNVVSEIVDINTVKGDGSLRLNGFAELLNEGLATKGMKMTVEGMIRMVNKAGQTRDVIAKKTRGIISGEFTLNASKIENAKINATTQVMLRTDTSSLMNNGFNIDQTIELMTDNRARNKEIRKRVDSIMRNPEGNDMIQQTKVLALYMAKEVAEDHLVKNAEAIAVGLGSWYFNADVPMDTALRDDIDVLASLYAIDMTTGKQRELLNALVTEERKGIEAMLLSHQEIAKNAKADFSSNPYNYTKGYMPQDTHHLRALQFVDTVEKRAEMIKQGWVEITEAGLVQDVHDLTTPKSLMFHRDLGYENYVSGALDMKDTHSKGTTVYDIKEQRVELFKASKAKMDARRRRAQMPHSKFNPYTSSSNTMVAAYDTDGSLVRYTYEMTGRLRDTYLERNNNGIDLLGTYNSDNQFKPQIISTQVVLAQEIHKDYATGYVRDPRKFVLLSPNSADPEVVKMWRMMPYAFREEATALFGKGQPIAIRSNVFNAVFGFKSYSMTEMFEKVSGERNGLENFLVTVTDAIFKDKAQMRVKQGERAIQSTVTQIKDFVVIRNMKVLQGNIISNALLLSLHGVKPVQQAKDFVSVWNNGKVYRELAGRIVEIDNELVVHKGKPTKLKSLQAERKRALVRMERNPLHKFMAAGLMSTIVEDVKTGKEDTTFKSDWDTKLDNLAGNIPEQVTTAFNWVLMSPGTPLHDFMSHATQFTDLAAKYSLAKHEEAKGASFEEAIATAQDNFINYDVPTSKGIDYLNRMGLFMFTKFFIRFQQVLLSRLNANATGAILQHIAVEELTGASGVLDPFALTRVGNNPLSPSVFGYNDAFNSISTVDFISSIAK